MNNIDKKCGSVFILDAENRSALAAIRALGKAGLNIIAGSSKKNAIGLFSRYVNEICIYNDPTSEPEKFINQILALTEEKKPQMLIPCTDLSLELILSKEKEFRNICCLPFSNNEIIKSILDKASVLTLAKELGIAIPESNNKIADVKNFPVAIKSSKSFNLSKSGYTKPLVKYAENEEQLKKAVAVFNEDYLIQQKIVGKGIGVFTLSKDGEVISLFCHQRLLEKPPSGGVSVLSESIAESEAPVAEAKKLIKKLKLNGIAMLEFKQHTDGKHYLMEINPRFWGSLQLAITCDRNFPLNLYKLFIHSVSDFGEKEYTTKHRLRWILGSLDHLIIRAKNEGILKTLSKNTLLLFHNKTSYDVLDLSDLKPFIRELRNYL